MKMEVKLNEPHIEYWVYLVLSQWFKVSENQMARTVRCMGGAGVSTKTAMVWV